MTHDEAIKVALWQAIEGYSGLWEVVWELNTLEPDSDAHEHHELAVAAVRELASRGWIELFTSLEPGGEPELVPRAQIETVLAHSANWDEPQPRSRSARISATEAGQAAYNQLG